MPSGNHKQSEEEFRECIDILYDITKRYFTEYKIIMGGDFNIDLTKINGNKLRRETFNDFLTECGYIYQTTDHTYLDA